MSDDPVEPSDDRVRQEALSRIAVRPPYFGLGAMSRTGAGVVSALIPAAPPTLPERGPLEAAQVARHLAILGSCAAALSRDDAEPHYYLASSAHYARLAGGPVDPTPGGMLQAEAVASWVDRRTARALVKLMTLDGRGLHLLDVSYAVLTPRVFRRLHPADETTPTDDQPAADRNTANRLEGEPVAVGPEGVTVDCGPVPTAACAGHFPDHPAAPVAIVMGQLCRAAGLALAARLDCDVHYRVEEGHVEATALARAGQRLVLDAAYQRRSGAGHVVTGSATADGEEMGRIEVTLSAIDARATTEAA